MENNTEPQAVNPTSRLRRDLGTLESYAALIGILIGAGIFQVTSRAWAITGPSVILGYLALTPAILATSIPYAAYLSTHLGREPGGEYLHISRAALLVFYLIHVIGIRWFGRMQVALSALKCLALLVLIVPGLFVLDSSNYTPFFTGGVNGFAASLLPLFFAYAGFESLAQTAGEVKDSTRRLPKILLKGIIFTALFYVFTSIVSFGVLPGSRLQASNAPMAEVASLYLPAGAAIFVTLGAIAAIMTALNGTIFVPSRLAIMFVEDGLAPRWLAFINKATATPIRGLTLTLVCCALLLISGQLALALNVAVFALVVLYFIHSLVFLFLPRLNPALAREIEISLPRRVQQAAAIVSLASMGVMILIQLRLDAEALRTLTFSERLNNQSLTSIELLVVWGAVGVALYQLARMQRKSQVSKAHGD